MVLRFAQELNEDGNLRYHPRANCRYKEEWILKDGENVLDQFDYKTFRYGEMILPEGVQVLDAGMCVRHYPFTLKTALKADFAADPALQQIWDLCVHTQHYGVQEVIQDLLCEAFRNDGAWKRMLREGGTTTFEGWGKDTRWNTSLFHLTMSYGALFMADVPLEELLL